MDAATTFITQAALAVVVGTQLLLAWYYDQKRGRPALYWGGAFFCVAIGWSAFLLRDNHIDLLPVIITNSTFLLAPVLLVAGVFVRMQKVIPIKILASVYIIAFCTQTSLTLFDISIQNRIITMNLYVAAVQFSAVFLVLGSQLFSPSNQMLAVGFFAVGLASALRAIGLLVTGVDFYDASHEMGRLILVLPGIVNVVEGFTCIGALLIDRIDQLSRQVLTDPLSKCLNRRGFDKVANELINRAKRGQNDLTLVVADLDRFKRVNDTYGHSAGDRVITTFAQMLSEETRTVDHVGRLGGEEFIMILWHTNLEGAKELVERIRKRLAHTQIKSLPDDFRITSSFGATMIEADESDLNDIIHRADIALYQAKENGRDQLQCINKEDETLMPEAPIT